MKKLGYLYVKTRNKLLVVKSTVENPDRIIGAEVYSSDMKKIGLVIDVIGRVSNPYVIVKPESLDIIDYLNTGADLYYFFRRRTLKKKPGRRVGKRYR